MAVMVLAANAHAATRIGAVEQLTNIAFGIPPDADRGPKSLDDDIVFQETIETLERSGMLVRFNDSTELTIGEKAVVLMDEFVYEPATGLGTLVILLSKGAFRFVSGNVPKGGVTIQTPSALIGIRGTELLIVVAADGSTRISVLDGLVEITPRFGGAAVAVEEEQSVEVSSDGEIGEVTDGVQPTGDRLVDLGVDFGSAVGSAPPGAESFPFRPILPPVRPIVRPPLEPSPSSPPSLPPPPPAAHTHTPPPVSSPKPFTIGR
jgi:hypothetical protein